MGLKTPVPLGQRVDIVPTDDSLGKVSRHLMTPGVLPYLDQLQGRQVELSRQAPSETPSLFRPSMFAHGGFGIGGMSDPFRFPLHGGFGEALQRMQQETQVPNLSKDAHPANGLYQQALDKVEARGESGQDAARIAGALTVAAQKNGLSQIDHVVASLDGRSYFASQGPLGSPIGQNAAVDVEQARQTSLSQSSRESMDQPRQQPPVQEAPTQQRAMHRE